MNNRQDATVIPPFRLTPAEIHEIRQLLTTRMQAGGADILGSQLGQFVKRAVSPKPTKALGGLRSLVDNELREFVEYAGATATDSLFRIKPATAGQSGPSIPEPLTGEHLWRYFSNPNIDEPLVCGRDGAVFVAVPGKPLEPEQVPLPKMAADEYQAAARAFAENLPDADLRDYLLATLAQPGFYSKWIACLRTARTDQANYLKDWENQRADLIARRLGEALEASGVAAARTAEIVANARPQVAAKPAALVIREEPGKALSPARAATDELAELRSLLHQAIDLMSAAELKDIKVPAGILLDSYRRSRN